MCFVLLCRYEEEDRDIAQMLQEKGTFPLFFFFTLCVCVCVCVCPQSNLVWEKTTVEGCVHLHYIEESVSGINRVRYTKGLSRRVVFLWWLKYKVQ